MVHTLLIATANPHKLHEITSLLSDLSTIKLVSLRDFPDLEMPPEDGLTMRDNARIKADYCAQATGLVALADDSGIEVDALGGAPGVHSARWVEGTDADRTNALLEKLREVPPEQRTARYRCVICVAKVAAPAGQSVKRGTTLHRMETEATCEGRITDDWRGENGFGYDPVFELTPATGAPGQWVGHTLAEAPPEIKAQISHRARAIAAIKPNLQRLFDTDTP
ncbi:MAG: non-canonical purine NTP pyrophosphatase [Abitibacteriaceae bacterium]|nr:non-canonical purine NTP pyrophosphatase [Abditibacteriaceae bacterium]